MTQWTRRAVLKSSSLAVGASLLPAVGAAGHPATPDRKLIHLNLNENAFGPSPRVPCAIQGELSRVSRYADASSAQAFAEQIAAYERVPVDQIVLCNPFIILVFFWIQLDGNVMISARVRAVSFTMTTRGVRMHTRWDFCNFNFKGQSEERDASSRPHEQTFPNLLD